MNNTEFLQSVEILVSSLNPLWRNGKPPHNRENWGPHYTFPGSERPVSVGRTEAYFLHNIAKELKPRNALEIGTGFGYSSWWIGHAMREGGWLGTMDNFSEGSMSEERTAFIIRAIELLRLSGTVEFTIAESPSGLNDVVGSRMLDIIFIDGHHYMDAPLNDFVSVTKYTGPDSVIVMHDVQEKYTVNKALSFAAGQGWIIKNFETSCGMAVCYRDPAVATKVERAFRASDQLILL